MKHFYFIVGCFSSNGTLKFPVKISIVQSAKQDNWGFVFFRDCTKCSSGLQRLQNISSVEDEMRKNRFFLIVMVIGILISGCGEAGFIGVNGEDEIGNKPVEAWKKVLISENPGDLTWEYYLRDWYEGNPCPQKSPTNIDLGENTILSLCEELVRDPAYGYLMVVDVVFTPIVPGDGLVIYGVIKTVNKGSIVIKKIIVLSVLLLPEAILIADFTGADDLASNWVAQNLGPASITEEVDPTHILEENGGTSSAQRRVETSVRVGRNLPQKCWYRPSSNDDPESEAVALGYRFAQEFRLHDKWYSAGIFIYNVNLPKRSTMIALLRNKSMLDGFEEIDLDDPRCSKAHSFWIQLLEALENILETKFPGAPLAPGF